MVASIGRGIRLRDEDRKRVFYRSTQGGRAAVQHIEVHQWNHLSVIDFDGMPPHDDWMEARMEKLEEFAVDAKKRLERLEEFATDTRERLVRIETHLDQMATKADLHELASTMVKWIVGSASG